MFTGIIERTGTVVSLEERGESARLTLDVGAAMAGELAMGESVAVNGCCLTNVPFESEAGQAEDAADAAGREEGHVAFDLLMETLRVTNLGDVEAGSLVNLERSLRVGDRMSGHFVQGHVDAVAEVVSLEREGEDHRLEVRLPEGFESKVVYKGSIAVDGISLTIAEAGDKSLVIWIIPHTWEVTNLRGRKAGERVNLEFDVLGKYVAAAVSGAGS